MSPTREQIIQAHNEYIRLSGYHLVLHAGRERAWFEFLKRFNVADLAFVIGYLQKRIRDGKRNRECLKLTNLIGDELCLDRFEEDMAQARAEARVKPVTSRDKVLEQSGRPRMIEDRFVSANKVLGELEAQRFFNLKKTL